MESEPHLTQSEINLLNDVDPGEGGPKSRPLGDRVQRLLTNWYLLIRRLETTGYRLSYENYTNEILGRTLLELDLRAEPLSGTIVGSQLHALDERFRAVTLAASDPSRLVVFRHLTPEEGWWEYRIPLVVVPVSPENVWPEWIL